MAETNLSCRMRELAKARTDLPPDWLERADSFDAATKGFYADPPTVTVQKFMGAYARARRMWCKATEEDLV